MPESALGTVLYSTQQLEVAVVLLGGGVGALAVVDQLAVLGAPVGLHGFRPLGDLRLALLGGHRQQLAMVEGLAAAPAGQILAVEQGGEARRRFRRRRVGRRRVCARGKLAAGGQKHQGGAPAAPADGLNQFHPSLFRLLRRAIKLFLELRRAGQFLQIGADGLVGRRVGQHLRDRARCPSGGRLRGRGPATSCGAASGPAARQFSQFISTRDQHSSP